MAPSEAQKKASAAYIKKNMATLGCKVKKDEANAFREYCHSEGVTVNTALRRYVLKCIGKDSKE